MGKEITVTFLKILWGMILSFSICAFAFGEGEILHQFAGTGFAICGVSSILFFEIYFCRITLFDSDNSVRISFSGTNSFSNWLFFISIFFTFSKKNIYLFQWNGSNSVLYFTVLFLKISPLVDLAYSNGRSNVSNSLFSITIPEWKYFFWFFKSVLAIF